jgi:hypothetical protein
VKPRYWTTPTNDSVRFERTTVCWPAGRFDASVYVLLLPVVASFTAAAPSTTTEKSFVPLSVSVTWMPVPWNVAAIALPGHAKRGPAASRVSKRPRKCTVASAGGAASSAPGLASEDVAVVPPSSAPPPAASSAGPASEGVPASSAPWSPASGRVRLDASLVEHPHAPHATRPIPSAARFALIASAYRKRS